MKHSMKGWIRLGIVLSVVWIVAFNLYGFIGYRMQEKKFTMEVRSSMGQRFQIVGSEGVLFTCLDTQTKGPVCQINLANYFLVMLGPVIAGWAVPLAIRSYQWVQDGFRADKT